MKGFMKDDQFHPITQHRRGTSKHRDQSAKRQGVKIIRKARTVTKSKLPPDVYFTEHYWGFETDSDGKISKLRLGNWVDAGWNWNGDEEDLLGYLVRVNHSQIRGEFLEKMNEAGITFNEMKPLLEKLVTKGSWLYEISGDNSRWKFHQDIDSGAVYMEELEYIKEQEDYSEEDWEKIGDEVWNHNTTYEFEDFEDQFGDRITKEVKDMIKDSNSFEGFFERLDNEDFQYQITEDYVLSAEGKVKDAIYESIAELKKKGEIKTSRKEKTDREIAEGKQEKLK